MAEVAYRLTRSDIFSDPFFVQLAFVAQGAACILRAAVCGHGRYPASPVVLKRGPLGALSVNRIKRALALLEGAGIIERYWCEGQEYLWFPDTDLMHSETYLKRDRPWSPYPAPPGYVDPKGEPPPRRRRLRIVETRGEEHLEGAEGATSPASGPGTSPEPPREDPGTPPVEPGDEPGPSPDEPGDEPAQTEPEPELPLPASREGRPELDVLWSEFCRCVELLRQVGHPIEDLDDVARGVWETTLAAFPDVDHRAAMSEWLAHWGDRARLATPIRSATRCYQQSCELARTRQVERDERKASGSTGHKVRPGPDRAKLETHRELDALAAQLGDARGDKSWPERVHEEVEAGPCAEYSRGLLEQLKQDEELRAPDVHFLESEIFVAGVDDDLRIAVGSTEALEYITQAEPRYYRALERAATSLFGAASVCLVVGGAG